MKSLVTTFLVFATCLVIAGTIALIDQAQATLSLSSGQAGQLTPAEKARISDRTTLSDLRQKYGDANVREVADAGDGRPGAVLFPDGSDKRIDVTWADVSRTKLASFMAWDRKSAWRTPQGVKPGQAIADVADLNGRAFILRGFAQPDAGQVVSWMGGKLAELDAGSCHVVVRLTPPPDQEFTTLEWRLAEIVQDAAEVSSDDRRIKPYKAAVSALGLEWR